MRLVCPNCGAQYEVEDSVVPDSGRDVQCSACGHAWYQMPSHFPTEDEVQVAEPDDLVTPDDDFEAIAEAGSEPEPGMGSMFEDEEPDAADDRDLDAEAETEAERLAEPDEAPSGTGDADMFLDTVDDEAPVTEAAEDREDEAEPAEDLAEDLAEESDDDAEAAGAAIDEDEASADAGEAVEAVTEEGEAEARVAGEATEEEAGEAVEETGDEIAEAEDGAEEVAEEDAETAEDVEASDVAATAEETDGEAESADVGAEEAETTGEADEEPGEEAEPALPGGMVPPVRDIDENLRAILREEADREMQARAADRTHEPQDMAIQPDLGLDSLPGSDEERRRVARERMAAMRGYDDEEDDLEAAVAADETDDDMDVEAGAAAAVAAGLAESEKHRRELFPDIDEINSTLDSHGAEDEADDEEEMPIRQGSFSRSFLIVIFLAMLALALYVLAPRLAESVPALEPALTAYVVAMNAAREWLDAMMQMLIAKIEGAKGGS